MNIVNEHITDYLSFYLENDVSFNFAVLIRGDWGCGKTWYIKNIIDTQKSKKFIYISLYGITQISDIEEIFFEQLHPVLASKGMKIAGKIVKGLIKASIKVDFDKDGDKDTTISTSLPGIDLPLSLKKLDNCILIFDDLERCTLPPDIILGYINQFIEHNNQKVIVIANEEEIQKSQNDKRYFEIKEKIIGRSFDYKADLDSALDVFLQEGKTSKSNEILKEKRGLISDLYIQAGYNNLRHLKQTIIDFHRFYSFWPEKCLESSELIEHLISFFFIISFELKKGDIRENEINKIIYSSQEKALLDKETPRDISRKKYSILNSVYSPVSEKIWTDYFKKGFIIDTEIKDAISNSPYFEEENTPKWVKLWRYWDLDDKEFEELISSFHDELKNKKIDDVFILSHIIGIFLNLSDQKLIDIKKDEIIHLGRNQIDYLKEKNKLTNINFFGSEINDSYGYQYTGLDYKEFKDFLSYLNSKVSEAKIDEYPNIANELLGFMRNSPNEFLSKINSYHGKNLGKIPILSHTKPQEFVAILCSLKNKDKRVIGRALKERYLPYDNYSLILEKEWLISIQKEIYKKIKNKKDSLSKRILKSQADSIIKDSIELLQNTKNNK